MRLRRQAPTGQGGRAVGGGQDPLAHLAAGAQGLRVGAGRWSVGERALLVAGGVLAPVGVILVLLGWFGAARTSNVFEQVPYLISGGLLGLALVFLGGFLYFAHWLTQLVHEQRAGSAAVVQALQRLADAVERLDGAVGAVGAAAVDRPPDVSHVRASNGTELVVTAAGTLAHRPTCRVVVGRAGLRSVRADEGFAPCRLCQPYG